MSKTTSYPTILPDGACGFAYCGCKEPNYTFFWKKDSWNWGWYENPRVASTQIKHRLRIHKPAGYWASQGFFRDFHDIRPSENSRPDNLNFTFGFVRNPYSRIVSCFDMRRWQKFWDDIDINQFVDRVSNCREEDDHHWYFQHWYVPPDKTDFIGKLENFEDDWKKVEDIAKLRENSHLTIDKNGDRVDWRHPGRGTRDRQGDNEFISNYRQSMLSNLNSSSLSKIQKMYEADFDLFHYSKDISKLL